MSAAQFISLWHLQNRVKYFSLLKEKHPEQKEFLDKKVSEAKELIIKTVMQMDENLAATIYLKPNN